MAGFLKRLACEEDGATMIEYAMLVALIGVNLVTAVTTMKNSIGTKFSTVSSAIGGAS